MVVVVHFPVVRANPWGPYRSSYAWDGPLGCPFPSEVLPFPFRRVHPSVLQVPFQALIRHVLVAYYRVVAFPCDGAYCLVLRDHRPCLEACEDFADDYRDDFRDGYRDDFQDGCRDDYRDGAEDDDSFHPLSLEAYRTFLRDPYQLGSCHLSYCYQGPFRQDSSAAVVIRDRREGLLRRNSDRFLQAHY